MEDQKKSKKQLIEELNLLRKNIVASEKNEKKQNSAEYAVSGKSENIVKNKKSKDEALFATLQNIINIFHYFIIIIDEDHNIILANDAVLNSLGKKLKDISGCFCPNVIHGIDTPFPGCPLEEALEKGHYVEKELLDPFYKKWVSSAIYPMNLKTQDGKKLFFHIAIDISSRKESENTISRQYDFLKNVLESLKHPFYIINVNDYTVSMANSSAGFGDLTSDSNCYKLTHKTDKPCGESIHVCPIDKIKITHKPVVVEHEHYTKGGIKKYYEIHGYPIFDNNGEITQIIDYSLDSTKQKQREININKIKNNIDRSQLTWKNKKKDRNTSRYEN